MLEKYDYDIEEYDIENLTTRQREHLVKMIFIYLFILPRKAFRIIIKTRFNTYTFGLILMVNMAYMYKCFSIFNFIDLNPKHIDRDSFDVIWIGICFLFGWIPYLLMATILDRKDKSKGEEDESNRICIFRILYLASIPPVLTLPLKIITDISPLLNVLLNILLYIWVVILMVIGISEVQKTTMVQAASNVMQVLLMIVVAGFILINLISLI